jgi:hypothetical protein
MKISCLLKVAGSKVSKDKQYLGKDDLGESRYREVSLTNYRLVGEIDYNQINLDRSSIANILFDLPDMRLSEFLLVGKKVKITIEIDDT